jgi:hypothetical protein
VSMRPPHSLTYLSARSPVSLSFSGPNLVFIFFSISNNYLPGVGISNLHLMYIFSEFLDELISNLSMNIDSLNAMTRLSSILEHAYG